MATLRRAVTNFFFFFSARLPVVRACRWEMWCVLKKREPKSWESYPMISATKTRRWVECKSVLWDPARLDGIYTPGRKWVKLFIFAVYLITLILPCDHVHDRVTVWPCDRRETMWPWDRVTMWSCDRVTVWPWPCDRVTAWPCGTKVD